MSDKIICPACGSSDSIEEIMETEEIKEPFVESKKIEVTNYRCLLCGAEGDFAGQSKKKYTQALTELKNKAVNRIIEDFDNNNISMASIERALELPQRTLTKWKNGLSSPTAAGIALLKIIRTYPWILDVAQSNFNPLVSRNVFINNAINEFLRITPVAQYQYNITQLGVVTMPKNEFIFYLKFGSDIDVSESQSYNAEIQSGNTEEFILGSINSNAIPIYQSLVKANIGR